MWPVQRCLIILRYFEKTSDLPDFKTFERVLRNLLIIHVMELRISLISAANTTAKDYNNALHGPLQLCKRQGGWLEKS